MELWSILPVVPKRLCMVYSKRLSRPHTNKKNIDLDLLRHYNTPDFTFLARWWPRWTCSRLKLSCNPFFAETIALWVTLQNRLIQLVIQNLKITKKVVSSVCLNTFSICLILTFSQSRDFFRWPSFYKDSYRKPWDSKERLRWLESWQKQQ